MDAATNFVWALAQKTKLHNETIGMFEQSFNDLQCRPKAICGDNYFMDEGNPPQDLMKFYQYYGIKTIPLGPHTPWPNRAEAAVKIIKHNIQILADSLRRFEEELPSIRHVPVRHLVSRACWARNMSVTYGGKTPAESVRFS